MKVWEAERDEMFDLADRLDHLDDEQWDSPSLCARWRVRDVLAHVTAGAEGALGASAVVRGMLRHGFDYNRWVAADGRKRGGQDPAVLLSALRAAAADRQPRTGVRPVRGLMHVVIHGQDMCRPLGIRRHLSETHLLFVATHVKDDVHIFGAKKRVAGLTLKATDIDWSHGSGPEVSGPLEALIMMMAGRPTALDELSGEGKADLIARQ